MEARTVKFENDEINYWIFGDGIPLVLIPGGGGDSWWYIKIAQILSTKYKVIIYDRRANATSTMNEPINFSIEQQSRDLNAILIDANIDKAIVFRNSSGASIAFDFALRFPMKIFGLVAHEPPLARVHSNSKKWQKFFSKVYKTGMSLGSSWGALRFALGVGLPIRAMANGSKEEKEYIKHQKHFISGKLGADILIKHELLSVTNYLPDFVKLKNSGFKIITLSGQESLKKKCFYAETSKMISEKYGFDYYEVPGHHISFYSDYDPWCSEFINILKNIT